LEETVTELKKRWVNLGGVCLPWGFMPIIKGWWNLVSLYFIALSFSIFVVG
jgi:hypothetical protein